MFTATKHTNIQTPCTSTYRISASFCYSVKFSFSEVAEHQSDSVLLMLDCNTNEWRSLSALKNICLWQFLLEQK